MSTSWLVTLSCCLPTEDGLSEAAAPIPAVLFPLEHISPRRGRSKLNFF